MRRIVALLILLASLILLATTVAFADSNGKQTVVTSGVPVQLVTTGLPVACTIVTIQAKSGNVGTIWVGFGPTVSATTGIGIALGPPITAGQPGGSYSLLPAGNSQSWQLGNIYIDATVSGDGVTYTCH